MTAWLMIGGKKILAALHAVAAGLSQSAAREKVGQPFLLDHTCTTGLLKVWVVHYTSSPAIKV
jgi:hypothetical protein